MYGGNLPTLISVEALLFLVDLYGLPDLAGKKNFFFYMKCASSKYDQILLFCGNMIFLFVPVVN